MLKIVKINLIQHLCLIFITESLKFGAIFGPRNILYIALDDICTYLELDSGLVRMWEMSKSYTTNSTHYRI